MFRLNRRKFITLSTAVVFAEPMLTQSVPPGESLLGQRNQYRSAVEKLEAMTAVAITDWRVHADNLPHPEDPSLNDSAWPLYNPPQPAASRFLATVDSRSFGESTIGQGPTWFRKLVETPRAMGGYDIQGLPLRLNFRLFLRRFMVQQASVGRIRVFTNGTMVEMRPAKMEEPILLTESAKPGQKFLIAIYSPAPAGLFARLEVEYPVGESNPQTMLQEILCVQAASKGFPEGQSQRDSQLLAAVESINFGALDRGDQKVFDQSLAAADKKMLPLADWIKQFTIRAVGNAHIDMAYLWPWVETVEIVRDTFGTVLELIQEYSRFSYAQSNAQDYLWLEQYYPAEFTEIQKRVTDGRWEIVGGMWIEPDFNMPCGESLVRQLLTGKRYFQQKFGVDIKIGWNPDSFGFSWQLPQIYKRSGVDYFVTQKLSWNDTTKFPYNLFWWESPDGSKVLTYFPHGYGNDINPVRESQYVAEDTPLCSGFKEQMLLFGLGDHGGGPSRQMLDAAERWLKSPNAAFPNFKFSTAQEYFNEIRNSLENSTLTIPTWKNELYLQYHRGTYTTQAESKKLMRESEVLMLNSEKFCSLAMLQGRSYPQPVFEDCWRRVCFDQYHDLITGCSIHVSNEDLVENLGIVKNTVLPQLHASMEILAAAIDTRGLGQPVVVFNPLSWERTDVTEVEVQFPEPLAGVEVQDPKGQVMPSHVIARNDSTHRVKVRFLARLVPAMGYKVFQLISAPHPRQASSTLRVNGLTMENEFLLLEIDPQTGCISRLVNKKDGRNILNAEGKGNSLQTFVDKPKKFDGCNIGWPYEQTKVELLNPEEVKLIENTPVRAVIRIKKNFQQSSFIQDICVYPEISRSDVHMHADWHEHHIMLKVAFPLDIAPLMATYEIPYGTIERPAIPHVPGKPPVPFTEATLIKKRLQKYDPLAAQEAEFEVCAQRWGDLSQGGRGFSLLNACKYGYDTVEPGTIRLTLLRSPISPVPSKDPHDLYADQGSHDFTYAMFPHEGSWMDAGTEHRGYELNYPLLPLAVEAHTGALPPSHAFVEIEPKNVILTAVKRAEDDNSLIFRFFEFEGRPAQVRLSLPRAAVKAVQTNLMEREENTLSLTASGKEVLAQVGSYEIKSVKVYFENSGGPAPPPFTA